MSEDNNSNTVGNSGSNLKPFKKGDPRINRKGRPKSFDALRKEAIKLAGESLTDPNTGQQATIARLILEGWASSSDWQAQRAFIEYGFGKVPAKDQTTNINIDLDSLTDEQLQRIANGDDPARVLADSRRGASSTQAQDASEADRHNSG